MIAKYRVSKQFSWVTDLSILQVWFKTTKEEDEAIYDLINNNKNPFDLNPVSLISEVRGLGIDFELVNEVALNGA